MLARQEPAGTTKPGLDFVGDKQRAVFAAEFERSLQIAIVRQVLSLNGLDEEGRHRCEKPEPVQCGEIVESTSMQSGSSGPVNSAIIAGNAPKHRLRQLRASWDLITERKICRSRPMATCSARRAMRTVALSPASPALAALSQPLDEPQGRRRRRATMTVRRCAKSSSWISR